MNYAGVYFNTPQRLMEQAEGGRHSRTQQPDLQ